MDIFFGIVLIVSILALVVGIVLLIVAFATKQKLKIPLIVMAASIAIFAVTAIGDMAHTNHVNRVAAEKAAKQAAHQRAVEKKMNANFDLAYYSFTDDALKAASKSETLANKVDDTWGDAITNDSVTIDGKQYTDFSKAIDALEISNTATVTKITTSESNMNDDLATMDKNTTSKNLSKENSAVKIDRAVTKLDSIATNPTGTYDSYGDKFSTADDKVASLMQLTN